jgi:hypothetical protein
LSFEAPHDVKSFSRKWLAPPSSWLAATFSLIFQPSLSFPSSIYT